jgi:hypothetical protein
MKRVFISLAAGLLIIPLLFGLLLAVKLFSPTNYPPAFLWLFLWPLPFLRLLCRMTNLTVTAGRVLVVGLFGDYLLLSFLAYLSFAVRARRLERKRRSSSVAPPPVPFTG